MPVVDDFPKCPSNPGDDVPPTDTPTSPTIQAQEDMNVIEGHLADPAKYPAEDTADATDATDADLLQELSNDDPTFTNMEQVGHAEAQASTPAVTMSQFLLGLVMDLPVPSGQVSPWRIIAVVWAILNFLFLAQLPSHSTSTLTRLDDTLAQFHDNKDVFIDLGIRNQFNLPKIHCMLHYSPSIRLFGTTDNYNTEQTEQIHINVIKDKFTNLDQTEIIDSIQVRPEQKDKRGRLIPAWFDTVLVHGKSQGSNIRGEFWQYHSISTCDGYTGHQIAQVWVVFKIPSKVVHNVYLGSKTMPPQHLAYVEWFSPIPAIPGPNHNLYKVTRLMQCGRWHASIIPVESILCSVHLLPSFGQCMPWEWNSFLVLELCNTFYVNLFSNQDSYMIF